ncbi:MAG: hypothetical protein JNG89_03620 [Planctomycetaceae bacterium]|nr:hypothetical protein [Planctomycetaceae bacterium]
MKRFALSAMVLTALACPTFGDEELAGDIAPAEAESLVAEFAIDAEVGSEEVSEEEPTDVEPADLGKDEEFSDDDTIRVTTDVEDGYVLRTLTDEEGSEEENPLIYYTMSPEGGSTTDSADASLSVNQLADEQRATLRLFSGRDAAGERRGAASSLKEFFSSRSRATADVEARTSALSTTEREAARRKAEIDQLRDEALRTGDAALLARADAMAAAQVKGSVKARSFFGLGKK